MSSLRASVLLFALLLCSCCCSTVSALWLRVYDQSGMKWDGCGVQLANYAMLPDKTCLDFSDSPSSDLRKILRVTCIPDGDPDAGKARVEYFQTWSPADRSCTGKVQATQVVGEGECFYSADDMRMVARVSCLPEPSDQQLASVQTNFFADASCKVPRSLSAGPQVSFGSNETGVCTMEGNPPSILSSASTMAQTPPSAVQMCLPDGSAVVEYAWPGGSSRKRAPAPCTGEWQGARYTPTNTCVNRLQLDPITGKTVSVYSITTCPKSRGPPPFTPWPPPDSVVTFQCSNANCTSDCEPTTAVPLANCGPGGVGTTCSSDGGQHKAMLFFGDTVPWGQCTGGVAGVLLTPAGGVDSCNMLTGSYDQCMPSSTGKVAPMPTPLPSVGAILFPSCAAASNMTSDPSNPKFQQSYSTAFFVDGNTCLYNFRLDANATAVRNTNWDVRDYTRPCQGIVTSKVSFPTAPAGTCIDSATVSPFPPPPGYPTPGQVWSSRWSSAMEGFPLREVAGWAPTPWPEGCVPHGDTCVSPSSSSSSSSSSSTGSGGGSSSSSSSGSGTGVNGATVHSQSFYSLLSLVALAFSPMLFAGG